jgi:hypothetical protein
MISAVALTFGALDAKGKDVRVRGYTRNDGTYAHYRSSPDSNTWNNYSTKGNVNPYTGKEGTRDPYSSTPPNNYRGDATVRSS